MALWPLLTHHPRFRPLNPLLQTCKGPAWPGCQPLPPTAAAGACAFKETGRGLISGWPTSARGDRHVSPTGPGGPFPRGTAETQASRPLPLHRGKSRDNALLNHCEGVTTPERYIRWPVLHPLHSMSQAHPSNPMKTAVPSPLGTLQRCLRDRIRVAVCFRST